MRRTLLRLLPVLAVAGLSVAVSTSSTNGAAAAAVPLTDVLAQYAPAGLHLRQTAPVTISVGGNPVVFGDSSNGVYSGSAGGVTATLTFTWVAAAQVVRWDIQLVNTTSAPVGSVLVTPLDVQMAAALTGSPAVVPCVKSYAGSGGDMAGTSSEFASTSTAALDRHDWNTATTSSVLQVAMNTKDPAHPQACDEQRRSSLAGFYAGVAYSAGWHWRAGWQSTSIGAPFEVSMSAEVDADNPGSPLTLAAGENLAYPTTHLGFATGASWNDIENAQSNYVRTQLRPSVPGQQTASPVSYDSYFGVDGKPTLPFLEQQARQAAALGVQYFTVDAGWYQDDGSGDQFPGLGNSLTPSIAQYSQGQDSLRQLFDYVRLLGMKPAIWLVPQAASGPSTDAVALSPNASDWVGTGTGYGVQKLQVQTKSAQDWAVSFLDQVINAYGVKWIRFETQTPSEFMPKTAPYNSIEYSNGVASVFRRVRQEHPDVYLEGSQAGGHRADLLTASVANGDWSKDFSIDPLDSRSLQLNGLRMWPASFLNLTDAGCVTNTNGMAGSACKQPYTTPSQFDNTGDPYKVISRMAGKLSFDGYISQWPEAGVAVIRDLVARYTQTTGLQEQPAQFPLPTSTTTWDAVAFGGAASASGVTPAYPASPGQALYVFRGNAADSSSTFCLTSPANATNTFSTLYAGAGGSITDAGACPTTAANYSPGAEAFTVTIPASSGALFLRNVTGRTAPSAPSAVHAVQADRAVQLNWTNSSAGAGTLVSRTADSGATWQVVGAVAGNTATYVDADIASGATYGYKLQTFDASVANMSAGTTSSAVPVQATVQTENIYDSDPRLAYLANAGTVTANQHVLSPLPSPYGTSHSLASAASVTYTCNKCSRITWNGRKQANGGTATVTLTSSSGAVTRTQNVSMAANTTTPTGAVFDSGAVPSDNYTVNITSTSSNAVELAYLGVDSSVPTLIDDAATPPAGDTLTYSPQVVAFSNLPSSRGYFGDTAHSTNTAGGSFTYSCHDCTGMTWLSHTGPDFGSVSVTLDGVVQNSSLNNNRSTTSATAQPVYSTGTLPLGTHTLTLTNLGSGWSELDGLQVARPLPGEVGTATLDASEAGWMNTGFTAYGPTSAALSPTNYYHQRAFSTNAQATDGSVQLAFTCGACDRLQLVASTAANRGIAAVTVTDETGATVASGSVDTYSPILQPGHVIFDSGLLAAAAGKHYTVTIRPTAAKNAASSDYWIEIQAVRATAPPVVSSAHPVPPTP